MTNTFAATVSCAAMLMSACPAAEALSAAVKLVQPDPSTWAYSVQNNEAVGSPDFVLSFALTAAAPFQVLGTPAGWSYDTDNATFVYWFSTDDIPFSHDIAPGSSLGGFVLSAPGAVSGSLGFTLSSWDHVLNLPGSAIGGVVLAPSMPTGPVPTPEPNTGLLVLIVFLLSAAKCVKKACVLRAKSSAASRSLWFSIC
jgi:hypothetical protein